MKYAHYYVSIISLLFFNSCQQNQSIGREISITPENSGIPTLNGPNWITRNIIQDKKGTIWIAAFDGVFRYDGKSFTNVTKKVSPSRFFSVLEDKKGNLWFGSIGSGVYRYNEKSFINFTTDDGLLNNEVTSIHKGSDGTIWFGVSGGTSRFDGKSFKNYIANDITLNEDRTGKTFTNRQATAVNTILEDKKGNFWFSTGSVVRYDGKSFTAFTHSGKPFKNVRTIIEDKKGNIWLGGADGLWRYDGSTFTNFTKRFVGHILEDKKGNIWISSGKNGDTGWTLSRYDEVSLSNKNPTATTIINKKMIFGIFEDSKGDIWFGDFDGVHRYDGNKITDFKSSERKE
jgi:ligand-binding sensor domain-containing protein